MSALTDLFTALANKIRSKTGGSATYTPPQMVAAIDDVYDAGVAAGTKPTQTKSAGPNVSTNKDVTPDSGYLLSKVTITPLSHTGTYTPAADTAANDMGEYHDKRYVNTSGMIVPSGDKAITANGSGIDVKSFSTVSVSVPNPTLSGDAATGNVLNGKTFYNNTYTKQTGTMTNQGAWTSIGNTANATTTKNVAIPAGYHNGSGYVQLASLSSQTGVDSGKTAIDASHVHSGYQGWVNGSKVSGSYTPPSAPSIYNPDKQVHVSLAKNASTTVSVDQLPRYIIVHWAMYGNSTLYMGGGEYDVNANKKAAISWTGSSTTTNKNTTGVLDIVPSVSSTSITVKNTSSSYTRHVCLDIYY